MVSFELLCSISIIKRIGRLMSLAVLVLLINQSPVDAFFGGPLSKILGKTLKGTQGKLRQRMPNNTNILRESAHETHGFSDGLVRYASHAEYPVQGHGYEIAWATEASRARYPAIGGAVTVGGGMAQGLRHHDRTCPSLSLRLSLPQFNIPTLVSEHLNLRAGASTKHPKLAQFQRTQQHNMNLLMAHRCWVLVSGTDGVKEFQGWVLAKYLDFSFQNYFVMPGNVAYARLGKNAIYSERAQTTYKIEVTSGTFQKQGSAVAVSPAILVTNCHVVGKNARNIFIVEKQTRHRAYLIHSKDSEDRCFIRSLDLSLRPVKGVRKKQDVNVRETTFAIGAPRGQNRTLSRGRVIKTNILVDGYPHLLTTAFTKPGSSGGGLFDAYGNLIGVTSGQYNEYFYAIYAEDFWNE